MNIKTLRQIEALNREIECDQNRLQKYRCRVESATARWGTTLKIGDEREEYVAEVLDLSKRISKQVRERMQMRGELLDYIDTIADSTTREIFKKRYVDGKSWAALAQAVHMSESAVKKRHAKQIAKENAKNENVHVGTRKRE